jgi:HEAT repeat protein
MYMNRQITRGFILFAVVVGVATTSLRADDAAKASSEKEQELLAVLRSDAPPAEKAITCKLLAIHGSDAAVPDLAELLSNEQLASWSRIALEAIPGNTAGEALRNATDSLDGQLLVGVLNSIGVRQDDQAVELLTKRLQDDDVEVASAAAVALGHIGNSEATQVLRKSLAAGPEKIRSAIAEGCVLCAEQSLAAGDAAVAVEIYDEVRNADVPQQRIIEGLRGAILARGQDGIPLLIEQAMADRPETVVLPAILQAAAKGPQAVRLSAIDALGRVGDASCLSALLDIATEGNEELTQAAKATLADLPGENVNAQVVKLLPTTEGKKYPLLLEVVGTRRIAAVPTLLKALEHDDADVRHAALSSLGETVELENLSALIARATKPKHSEDAPVAQRALKAASIRMPDREACAAQLAEAVQQTQSVQTKVALLEILAEMGGTNALATIAEAAKSNSVPLQESSSALLGKWMTADAAPVLLDLAKTLPAEKYHVRALRGYVRIARQFNLPEDQRAEMCGKALDASRRAAERKLVLEVLARYPNAETLKLAIDSLSDPEVKDKAYESTLVIAQKLGDKGGNVQKLLAQAGLEKIKLEIIEAKYGAGNTYKDVTKNLQKQVRDLPLILLSKRSYNKSFGGDPAPGSSKELTVKYRINGKEGEATFAENAVIVLPMPK